MEALFKYALFKIDPVLLLDKESKVKDILTSYENVYKLGEDSILESEKVNTITLRETVSRLHDLGLMEGVANQIEYDFFYKSVEKLDSYRNKLQHFGLKADPELLARILGAVIPRAIQIIEATYARVSSNDMPYSSSLPTIKSQLTMIYPEWQTVYGILVNQYDELIQNAIRAFTKNTFKDLTLSFKVEDHGEVGAPPYLPEIKCEGFINFDMEPHMFLWSENPQERYLPYTGKVTISKPTTIQRESHSSQSIGNGSIELSAQVYLDTSKAMNVRGLENEISVLRKATVKIQANITYEAEVTAFSVHYSIDKLTKVEGQLNVVLEILPMGSKSEKEEIIGEYKAELTESNNFIQLHAFREQDGSIRPNYVFEWKINAIGDLLFL
jgi:hypothetical protein